MIVCTRVNTIRQWIVVISRRVAANLLLAKGRKGACDLGCVIPVFWLNLPAFLLAV